MQPFDICVENSKTMYVVNPAASCVQMITPLGSVVEFLRELRNSML